MKAELPKLNLSWLYDIFKPKRVRIVQIGTKYQVETTLNKFYPQEWCKVAIGTGKQITGYQNPIVYQSTSLTDIDITFKMAVLEMEVLDLKWKREYILSKRKVIKSK